MEKGEPVISRSASEDLTSAMNKVSVASEEKVLFPWAREEHWKKVEGLLSQTIETREQLEATLSQIGHPRFAEIPLQFFKTLLNELWNEEEGVQFFKTLLPFLQKLALRGPELFKDTPVEVLGQMMDKQVVLTREQVACIMANTFFLTMDSYDPAKCGKEDFPRLSFFTFYASPVTGVTVAGMLCLLNYFKRVQQDMPKGNITVHRQVLTKSLVPNWKKSKKPLSKVTVYSEGVIEKAPTDLHADFANRYIGGGVLVGGCVQEEILFLVKPECLVSLLFCSVMDDNEAIFITGAEMFSEYKGYGRTFSFGGNYRDDTARDADGTIKNTIVGFDATMNRLDQFTLPLFLRDLNKAYVSFFEPAPTGPLSPIATGNWGCGAFGGDKQLKVLQQIIAASEAGREVLYYTFKDVKLEALMNAFIAELNKKKVTVGKLVKAYEAVAKQATQDAVFELILHKLK